MSLPRQKQLLIRLSRHVVQPDTFRLRYRVALSDAVKAIVAGLLPTTLEASCQTWLESENISQVLSYAAIFIPLLDANLWRIKECT